MKKKGFTLIELLAVIVILAVIALITTPMILGVVEEARKKAAVESVNGILSSLDTYMIEHMLVDVEETITFEFPENELSYKGSKPESGTLLVDSEGKTSITVKINGYCVRKKFNETVPVIVEEENCLIEDIGEEKAKIYGIKRLLETDSSSWERIEDSVGLVANAQIGTTEVQNDFDSIYPWSDIISYNYNTDTKQVTAYYGEENFKFDGSNGEVLTKIPEFYYKREQDGEYEYIYISKEPQEGYIKSEEFSVGRYTMSGDATRVHSISGYTPLGDATITEFRTYARNLGEEFGQMDWHYFILQLLYLVEYADYNSQSKLGKGYTNSSHTGPTTSGGCDILGMHSGSTDGTDNSSIIYRGIEDIFGNVWQFIDGLNIRDNQAYICYDKNEYAVDTFTGCYQKLGYVNANAEGYASKLGYDFANPMVAITTEAVGSSSTNMCDYLYRSARGDRMALVGGAYPSGAKVGLWFWNFSDTSSYALASFGARLLKTN